jgi:predicted Fe-S protein YdhL (DUF1289 family)
MSAKQSNKQSSRKRKAPPTTTGKTTRKNSKKIERTFNWIEPVAVTENFIELVRHPCVTVAVTLKDGCENCEALREALVDFDFGEGGKLLWSGGEGSHHTCLQVRPPGSNEFYTLKMDNSSNSAHLRKQLTSLFHVEPHTPHPHQQRLASGAAEDPKSMLIGYQLGAGKTDAAYFSFDAMASEDVIVVASKILLGQWWDTLVTQPGPRLRVRMYGYKRFAKEVHYDENLCVGCELAVDEAHRWKNFSESNRGSIQAATAANVIYMLTGTPVRNEPRDIDLTLHLLGLDDMIADEEDLEIENGQTGVLAVHTNPYKHRLVELRDALRGRVALYDPQYDMSPAEFASKYSPRRDVVVHHHLGWVQASMLALFGQGVNIRVDGTKVCVNGKGGHLSQLSLMNAVVDEKEVVHSSKRDAVLKKIKEVGLFPQVVYSSFKADMLQDLHDRLVELKYGRVVMLTGDIDSETRHDAIRDYNKGKIALVLICRVGNEGVDLSYPAHALHLLEGQNNEAEEDQIIGRVLRMRKPGKQPVVSIMRYVGHNPRNMPTKALVPFIETMLRESSPLNRAFGGSAKKVMKWVIAETKRRGPTVEERIFKANRRKAEVLRPIKVMLWMAADGENAPWEIRKEWEVLTREPAGERKEKAHEKEARAGTEKKMAQEAKAKLAAERKIEKIKRSQAHQKRKVVAAAKKLETEKRSKAYQAKRDAAAAALTSSKKRLKAKAKI